jgi:hypothetical protein
MVQKRKNIKNKRSTTKRTRVAHVRASLSYVAAHRHTGHRLHRRHTSHGILLLLLIVVGIVLFLSLAALRAAGLTESAQVNVTLTVPGPPPSVGAVITSPADKVKVKQSILQVAGTCPSGTLVAIYNNGLSVSSTICSSEDLFQTNVQLTQGLNTLQAQNYDALNQPGPTTDQIVVEFAPDVVPPPAVVNTPADITLDPSIPDSLAPLPHLNPCYAPVDPGATTQLGLVAPCITRNVFIGQKLELPISILGGSGPYALSVNWGDGDTQLYSFASSGHQTLSHTYLIPKVKGISLHLADSSGQIYQIQSVIDVNDDGTAATGISPVQATLNDLSGIWLEASVPVYWAIVSLFVGFWVGDLFQRFLGLKPRQRRYSR